jgi:ABC-type glycerol-3-phosphate transport system substrate-binding protein
MPKQYLSRRQFLKLGLLSGGALVIARCAPAPTPTPESLPEPTSPPPAASDATYAEWINSVASSDPLEVRIVHWFDPNNPSEHNQDLMDWATGEWKKRYPNGKINWELVGWGEIDQKTPGYVMANEAVDISYNWGGATENWCQSDLLLPLDGQMPKWWVDSRVPAILEPPANDLCSDGRLVMAALGLENQCMMVRKDLLQTAGVDPSSMGSYEGFLAGLQAIAKQPGFEKPYAFKLGADYSAMDSVLFLWLGNGISFGDFREDGSEKDAWIQAATFVKGLMDLTPEAALNWGWAEVEQAYSTGQIAAMDHGSWFYSVGKTIDTSGKIITQDATGVLAYPYGPSSPEKVPFYSFSLTGFYMLKSSTEKNRRATADLMAILSQTEAAWKHQDGTVPATTGWTAADRLKVAYDKEIGWWWQAWEDMKKNARTLPLTGFLARDEITGAAHPLLIAMFRNEITPEELYAKVRDVALPLIAEAKNK